MWMILGARESWWSLLSRARKIIQFDWFIAGVSQQTWPCKKNVHILLWKIYIIKKQNYIFRAETISFHEHLKSLKFFDKFLLEMIFEKICIQIIDEIPLILIGIMQKNVQWKYTSKKNKTIWTWLFSDSVMRVENLLWNIYEYIRGVEAPGAVWAIFVAQMEENNENRVLEHCSYS